MALVRNIPADLIQIFKASYTSVLPQHIVRKRVQYKIHTDTLEVIGKQIPLAEKKLFIVGAGKGVQYLARELETLMGPRIYRGIVSIPEGSLDPDQESYRLNYFEGAKDNLPDRNAVISATRIKALVNSLTSEDILLVLITGGGSALLPLPIAPITLDEKINLIKKLANAGADITELNTVRKRISDIKGGKLANCSASRIVTFIISDIVDDPLDLIASGPTVRNDDDPQMAIDILKRYSIYNELPESIRGVLEKENDEVKIPSAMFQNFIEGLKVNSKNVYEDDEYPSAKVLNFLLASNLLSIGEAQRSCNSLNSAYIQANQIKGCFFPIIISRKVTGNVKEVAKNYYKLVLIFGDYLRENIDYKTLLDLANHMDIQGVEIQCDFTALLEPMTKEKIICLILAGETTVEVTGTGEGGRNQQLALEFAKRLHTNKNHLNGLDIYMLSAGTDGIDGPTDAAGAISYKNLISESIEDNIDVNEYMKNNDSYNFFKNFKDGKYHIKTGHTNTNVMDIHLITVERVNFESNSTNTGES